MDLFLASKSPRRIKILTDTGYEFTIISSNFDERNVDMTENPRKGVANIALGKAKSAFSGISTVAKLGSVVLSADTIVVCDGEVLLKPKDESDARRMLQMLSGKKHKVYTAVALVTVLSDEVFVESTDVYFNALTDEEIDDYIKTGEPMDKAGAYAIQGKGKILIDKIDGDYYNVVGLPISKTAKKLKVLGVKPEL